MFLAACVQLRSTSDVEHNLATTERLVRRAAGMGAALVATPENTSFLGPQFHKVELAEPLDGPTGSRLSSLAKELGIHLLIGGLAERDDTAAKDGDKKRCFNTSVLYGPDGATIAAYRKVHLFDVDVPGGLTIRESDSIAPGDQVVVADTKLGRIGMTTCAFPKCTAPSSTPVPTSSPCPPRSR